jgi:hypothetical protein
VKNKVIKLRKQIFNNLKSKAFSYEGSTSKELILYKENQSKLSGRVFYKSDIEELTRKVNSSDIIYLGDFHTFDQNIRNVLRVIRSLKEQNLIIALEMVDTKYQFFIDTYLDGHLTDLEFLESINYHDSWRFPWIHYKLIFDLAKQKNIKILGLNTNGSLEQRDEFAATVLAQSIKDNKNYKHLVLYGELHIAVNKLPQRLDTKITNLSQVILHQNLDEVYWKQIEENNSFEIVKFNDFEFCMNSAPPWIKYESMIYWYENLCDDPDFDIHEYIIENGTKIFNENTHENFSILCEQLIKTSSIQVPSEVTIDFNLYDHTKIQYVEDKILELNKTEHIKIYEHLLCEGLSFKLPNHFAYYCSSYSVNRLSYLCGMHLFNFKNQNINEIQIINSKTNLFIYQTYNYAFAYFFSKIINPHRKCEMYQDFVQMQSQNTIYSSVIRALDANEIDNSLFSKLELFRVNDIALDIGHLLGEYIYRILTDPPNKQELTINYFYYNSKINTFSFSLFKKFILTKFDYQNHQKRQF